jgi:hypothetical protein
VTTLGYRARKLYTQRSRTLLSGGSETIDCHTSLRRIHSELEAQATKAKWYLEQEKKEKDERSRKWVCQQFLENDEVHRNLKNKGKYAEALRRYQDFHMLVSSYEVDPKALPFDVSEQERKDKSGAKEKKWEAGTQIYKEIMSLRTPAYRHLEEYQHDQQGPTLTDQDEDRPGYPPAQKFLTASMLLSIHPEDRNQKKKPP